MEQYQQIANELLWPIWRGMDDTYKRKYARTIWQQFEDQIRSSAYTSKLTKFLENICQRLDVRWAKGEDAARVAAALEQLDEIQALRILRSETTAVVLFVRLKNDERKAEYEKREGTPCDHILL